MNRPGLGGCSGVPRAPSKRLTGRSRRFAPPLPRPGASTTGRLSHPVRCQRDARKGPDARDDADGPWMSSGWISGGPQLVTTRIRGLSGAPLWVWLTWLTESFDPVSHALSGACG